MKPCGTDARSEKKMFLNSGEDVAMARVETAICPANAEKIMVGSQPSGTGFSRRRLIENKIASTGAAKGGTIMNSSGSRHGLS